MASKERLRNKIALILCYLVMLLMILILAVFLYQSQSTMMSKISVDSRQDTQSADVPFISSNLKQTHQSATSTHSANSKSIVPMTRYILTIKEWKNLNIELSSVLIDASSISIPGNTADKWVPWPIGASLRFVEQITSIGNGSYKYLNKRLHAFRSVNQSKTLFCAVGGGLYRKQFMKTLQQNGIQNIVQKSSYYTLNLPQFKFAISPEGNGVDCFRHYEALLFGVIPIINDSYNNMLKSNVIKHANFYLKKHRGSLSWPWYENVIYNASTTNVDHLLNQFLTHQIKYPYVEYIPYVSESDYQSTLKDEWFYLHKMFYMTVQEYHLSTIKSTAGQYSINRNYYILPNAQTLEYRNGIMRQTGNMLSVYWGIRSLAYWSTYQFMIRDLKQIHDRLHKDTVFTYYLPSSITTRTTSAKERYHSKLLYPDIVPREWKGNIHTTSMLFMYYNPWFHRIIHYETLGALNRFYEANNRSAPRIESTDTHVVIHIRCGDILWNMLQSNPFIDYGFLTMSYYVYVMKFVMTNSQFINFGITKNSTVYVISQLTNYSLRTGEQKAEYYCNYLVNRIVELGFNTIFAPAKVQIISKSDENDDYYRMINAPLLFCSPSTFCLNAALGNVKGLVIIPTVGPWIDLRVIDSKSIRFPNYNYIFGNGSNFIIKTELLPSNHVLIDTNSSGFHCHQIPTHNEEHQTLSFHTKTEQLSCNSRNIYSLIDFSLN
eukprot:563890_1